MNSYEFSTFLDSVKHLNPQDLDDKTVSIWRQLENTALSTADTQARREGAGQLLRQVGALRFWLATGGRPDGLSEDEFAILEPLCRNFVEKGQMKPEALRIFATARARESS